MKSENIQEALRFLKKYYGPVPPVVTVPGNIQIGGVTVLNLSILHLILCNLKK